MSAWIRLMRLRVAWVAVLCLPACGPQSAELPDRATPVQVETDVSRSGNLPEAIPESPRQPLRYTESRHGGVLVRGVAFDAREYRMRLADQKAGPGSEFADSAAAARRFDGVAAVNAGFFTPEGEPLGLVRTDGHLAGVWNNASSLGSALWLENQAGHMVLVRRSAGIRAAAASTRNLLQSGPLLVERGLPVSGLDDTKTSARSFLLWDGGQRWWMGVCTPVTLAGLGSLMASDAPVDWKPRMGLNLDGGRSSDLWVSGRLAGGDLSTRMPWNRPVRNFLVLVPIP